MKRPPIAVRMKAILKRDPRYKVKAYAFVNQALAHVVDGLDGPRHISATELLDGLRVLALRRYGNAARMVLERWGIFTSEDVGEIVFNLVEAGVFSRQDSDTRADFIGAMNFRKVFDDAEID